MEIMDLMKDFGPLVGIVLFFIWRDWRRVDDLQENLVERVKTLETFNTEVLTEMVKTNAAVIATNTEQLRMVNVSLAEHKARPNG